MVALVGCNSDDEPPSIDAAPDAIVDAAPDGEALGCSGPPPGGCEAVVAERDACPRAAEVCANVCGASYDCCYCDGEAPGGPAWSTLYLDCPPCPDAGLDAR